MCGTDEWVQIHCVPNDSEAFEVGQVVRVERETIVAHMIGTAGEDNGSRSISIETIMGVTVGSGYVEKLRVLRETRLPTVRLEPEGEGFEGMLRAAMAGGVVVSLRARDELVQGFVQEIGEGWTAIRQHDEEDGRDLGTRIISLEDAERVFAGGRDEAIIATAVRARQLRHSIG